MLSKLKMVSYRAQIRVNRLVAGLMLLSACTAASDLPAAERILQHGLPTQTTALQTLSTDLFSEYQRTGNLASQIFYAWSQLSLADHYAQRNDAVRAAEFLKTGFFYLDQAADEHEADWRVRYLRARVDAWLPDKLGRCVITLDDTGYLLAAQAQFDASLRAMVSYMRYRALGSCQQGDEQARLYQQLQTERATQHLLETAKTAAPGWDSHEAGQVLLPLFREK